jgi:hypothetical protein
MIGWIQRPGKNPAAIPNPKHRFSAIARNRLLALPYRPGTVDRLSPAKDKAGRLLEGLQP